MGVSPTDCQYEVLCPCLRLDRQRQLRGLHHRPGCPRRHLWRHHHRCGLWSRPCLWIWSHRQQGNLRLCPPRRLLRQEGRGGRARGLHNRPGRPRTPHPQRLRHWPPPQCRSCDWSQLRPWNVRPHHDLYYGKREAEAEAKPYYYGGYGLGYAGYGGYGYSGLGYAHHGYYYGKREAEADAKPYYYGGYGGYGYSRPYSYGTYGPGYGRGYYWG